MARHASLLPKHYDLVNKKTPDPFYFLSGLISVEHGLAEQFNPGELWQEGGVSAAGVGGLYMPKSKLPSKDSRPHLDSYCGL